MKGGAPTYVSVFAGRVADAGADPVQLMAEAVHRLATAPATELIWASPRQLLNIFRSDAIGCHFITVSNDIFRRAGFRDKDLGAYSLEPFQNVPHDEKTVGFVW